MKKVPRWNGFTFRCHDATNVRNREREREREREFRESTNKIQYNKYRNLEVRMHENA